MVNISNNEDQYLGKYLTYLLFDNTDTLFKILHETIVNEGAYNIDKYIKQVYEDKINTSFKDFIPNKKLKSNNSNIDEIQTTNDIKLNKKATQLENPEKVQKPNKSVIYDSNTIFSYNFEKKKPLNEHK